MREALSRTCLPSLMLDSLNFFRFCAIFHMHGMGGISDGNEGGGLNHCDSNSCVCCLNSSITVLLRLFRDTNSLRFCRKRITIIMVRR